MEVDMKRREIALASTPADDQGNNKKARIQ
jgi:hypothetical protein